MTQPCRAQKPCRRRMRSWKLGAVAVMVWPVGSVSRTHVGGGITHLAAAWQAGAEDRSRSSSVTPFEHDQVQSHDAWVRDELGIDQRLAGQRCPWRSGATLW